MTVQPIRLFGDPVLRTPTARVETFDKELRILVGDLTETMRLAPGAGLSANQIGVGLRVFTYDVEGETGHLVNPVLEMSEDTQECEEGCLSVPGIAYTTTRAARAIARGVSMLGEPMVVEGEGMLARCLQHETDHLDGVLFISRLSPRDRKAAMRDIRLSEWFNSEPPKAAVEPHEFGQWY